MLTVFFNSLPFTLMVYLGSISFTWITYGRKMQLEYYLPKRGARVKWYLVQEVKVFVPLHLHATMANFALDILKSNLFWVGLIGFLLAIGFGYLRAYIYDGDLAIRAFVGTVSNIICSDKLKRAG